jgi:transposase
MKEEIQGIETERVDDVPLLLGVIKQTGIIEICNETLKQHGNWSGLGQGYVIAVWLAYILSTGDHRKNQLEKWAGERLHTLRSGLGVEALEALDFTDDRLGIILTKLSDDESWQRSERAVNERIIRVYELKKAIARIDTTTVSSYGVVSEEGLLQFGHSKDHRPDLGQVKIASVSLDPLGMPLVTIPVSGEAADDGLYLPAIAEARQSVGGQPGMLYVGDSKMAALATRHQIAQQEDYYLMPLSQKQVSHETLDEYLTVWAALPVAERENERVVIMDEAGQEQLIAEGFTVTTQQQACAEAQKSNEPFAWAERRFVVRSPAYAKQQEQQLAKRLVKAQQELERIVERRRGYHYPESVQAVEQQVQRILTTHDCQAYFTVTISEEIVKQAPARLTTKRNFQLHLALQTDALTKAQQRLGWRTYATNAPTETLSFTKAVEVYRDAHLHEHGYSRLKGKPLSLTPMYLQQDTQITGLIRLLSLALRILTLIEFVVRKRLAHDGSALQGLYAGNPQRQTKTPRTETLLEAFKGITLTIIQFGNDRWLHLTPLSPTQKRILQLLDFSEALYASFVPVLQNSS